MDRYEEISQPYHKERLRALAKEIYMSAPKSNEVQDVLKHFQLVARFNEDILSSMIMDDKVRKLIENQFKKFQFISRNGDEYMKEIKQYFAITGLVIANKKKEETKA